MIKKHSDKLGMKSFCDYALDIDNNEMRNILKTTEIKEFTKNIIEFPPVINPSERNIKHVESILKDITNVEIDVFKERELIKGPDTNKHNKGFHL